jgi:hypothetical protein
METEEMPTIKHDFVVYDVFNPGEKVGRTTLSLSWPESIVLKQLQSDGYALDGTTFFTGWPSENSFQLVNIPFTGITHYYKFVAVDSSQKLLTPERLDMKVHGELFSNKDNKRIPEDEYIVFRAHDNSLLTTLRFYTNQLANDGADQRQISDVELLIERVKAWRFQHPDRCKVADVDAEDILGHP